MRQLSFPIGVLGALVVLLCFFSVQCPRGKVFRLSVHRPVSPAQDFIMVSRREQIHLDFLIANFKPVASCRDGVLYVRPIAPYNVFYVRGRKVVCCSQMLYLQPDVAKGLLPKDRRYECTARPEDGPEAHIHCNRTLDGTDSEGPLKAEIALLVVKWRMRLVVVQPPYKGGTSVDRSRALESVLEYLAVREIPAAGFITSLRSRYSFSSIKFSMDTAIAACMKSGVSWPAVYRGPASTLGFERATWGPRRRVRMVPIANVEAGAETGADAGAEAGAEAGAVVPV